MPFPTAWRGAVDVNSLVFSFCERTPSHRLAESEIVLPKFQLRYGNRLGDALRTMGMEVALKPGAADFSGIEPSQQLDIADVEHKTDVKVDE